MALDLNKIRPVSTGIQEVGQQPSTKKAETPKIDTFALGRQGLVGKFTAGAQVGGAARFLGGSYDARGLELCRTVRVLNPEGCENVRPAVVSELEAMMKETA